MIALAVSGLSAAIIPAIASATTKFVSAAAVCIDDPQSLTRILSASLLTVALIDVLLMAATSVFGRELSGWVFGPRLTAADSTLRLVLILAMVSVCLQQVDGVLAAALKALEQFKRQALVEMGSRGTLVVSVLAVTWITRDVRWVLVAYCAACGASTFVRSIVVRYSVPKRRLFAMPHRPDFSRLLRFGSWMWLNAIATIAYGTVDRIIIGRVAGPAAAGEFNLYLQFAQLVHFVPASLFAFSYPVFSRLGVDKRDNVGVIRQLYLRYTRIAPLVAAALALGILVFRYQLLGIVGGHGFLLHTWPFMFLLVGFFLLSLNIVPYSLSLALGDSRAVSLITSVSMGLSVAATSYLIPEFGIAGAAVARWVYGFGSLLLFWQANRLLRL